MAKGDLSAKRISLFMFFQGRGPGFVGVEAFHLLEFVERFRPKILLVNHAVVTDDEGPHSGPFADSK